MNPLRQVISGRKFWSDGSPVAGQPRQKGRGADEVSTLIRSALFDYGFDTIGNRTSTLAGGDQNGLNQRSASYTANALNQYTQRTVPGDVDVMGISYATNTVTVNGNTAYRKVEYFRDQLPVNNGSAALWTNIIVAATGQTSVTGNVFVAQSPESYGYDADGNLTSDGRWSYTWDGENRLVSLQGLSGIPTGAKFKLDFIYDPQGRRVQKLVSTNNGSAYYPLSTNRFLYDGWNLVAILNPASSLVQSFMWGTDLSGSSQGAGGVGGLLEISDAANGVNFIAFDGNGNVSALVKTTDGTVAATYEYAPFGEALRSTGSMGRANPLRFSSKLADDETDLLYYGYRYYSPSPGRWVSRDPALEVGGEELISSMQSEGDAVPAWKVTTVDLDYGFLGNGAPDRVDLLGMCDQLVCGRDVTMGLRRTQADVRRRYNNLGYWKRRANCRPWKWPNLADMGRAASGWDLASITWAWSRLPGAAPCGSVPACKETVHLNAGSTGCYYAWDVNYASFGWLNSLCGTPKWKMDFEVVFWKMLKGIVGDGGNLSQALGFANAGYAGWPLLSFPAIPAPPPKYGPCTACGAAPMTAVLGSIWPHADW